MKFGCLYYADSENIGDDIQTYVQWRFLPQVDYWIDRESLHIFFPDEEKKVALIMNAWFMYSPQNWPPSPYIMPLFISTHFSHYHMQWLHFNEKKYLFAHQYLKKNSPIGCRDGSTLQMLRSMEISAYFSGCLTLTIPPFPNIEKEDYVCLVDVSPEVIAYVKEKGYNVRVMTHESKVLKDMEPEERLKQVEKYLKIYQAAKCVLTSRLHCALPCTGLQTPVLVLYSTIYEERFNELKDFLHITNSEEFLKGEWDIFLKTPFCRQSDYIFYRKRLTKTCEDFIKNSMEIEVEPDAGYEWYRKVFPFQQFVQKDTYIAKNQELSNAYKMHEQYIHQLEEQLEKIKGQVKEERKMNDELRNYSANQDATIINQSSAINELKGMNDELRSYSVNQDKAIKELKSMNDELRVYSTDQEIINREIVKQGEEQKKDIISLRSQLENLQNLTERERKLILFIRKRFK